MTLAVLRQLGMMRASFAIASLEEGYANRDQWTIWLKVDPRMDDLRSDPRFEDLLLRVGFPQ